MMPTSEHIVFIPGVFLIGLFVGYLLGSRAVREEIRRTQERRRR